LKEVTDNQEHKIDDLSIEVESLKQTTNK